MDPEKPMKSRGKILHDKAMKKSNLLDLGLLELNSKELREYQGGYVPGDVVTDSDGNMWRCDYILPGGMLWWTKLEGNVC